MKNIQGIGILIWFAITIAAGLSVCKEKSKELTIVPSSFQGEFVETNEATALGNKPPIRIKVSSNNITILDPDRDRSDIYPINKIVQYENHVDFHYPDKYPNLCIRVYPIKGLFYFYDAEVVEEGLNENKIGVFSKAL